MCVEDSPMIEARQYFDLGIASETTHFLFHQRDGIIEMKVVTVADARASPGRDKAEKARKRESSSRNFTHRSTVRNAFKKSMKA